MTYTEQLEIEALNKKIINNIVDTVPANEFIDYYINHTRKETCEQYNLRNEKMLIKILNLFNYDFSTKKPSKFKGKKSERSHESYVAGGKKSAETQKQHWEEKSEEEKEAWSIKQSKAHSTQHFKDLVKSNNKAYRASLSTEEKARQDQMRSESMKSWWENLSEDEKDTILKNRFVNGKHYSQKESGPNIKFGKMLNDNNLEYTTEFCLDRKLFDFKVNDLLIEINPTITHNSTFTPFNYSKPLDKKYHATKTEVANKHNFRCIHIFDWDDKTKIINLIKNQQKIIYGRLCEAKEISTEESNIFLDTYHLQGSAKSAIKLGLYFNEELVSVMTFGKPRYNKNYEYELIRYCASAKVIGGAEKLFKYFIEKYTPDSVISYCDLSKFSGETYTKLNFTLLRSPGPSKHWYNSRTKEHYTDNLLRQQGFSRLVNHCDAEEDNLPTNNNKQLMIEHGFVEIYDCGQATYIWKNNN